MVRGSYRRTRHARHTGPARHEGRDGTALVLLGMLALAITSAVLLVAVPELFTLARAAAAPVALAPF